MFIDKIRGCMYGILIGDCVGALFEEKAILSKGSRLVLKFFLDNLGSELNVLRKPYTDDTALTLALIQTVIDTGNVDQRALGINFVNEYYKNVHRNYSEHFRKVFIQLKKSNFEFIEKTNENESDNGAATYIAPIAFLCMKDKSLKIEQLVKKAVAVTHANELAVNGALLQARAVFELLKLDGKLNTTDFLNSLRGSFVPSAHDSEGVPCFIRQLQHISNLLNSNNPSAERVVNLLGHSHEAIYSVPTAIYCFLKNINDGCDAPEIIFRNAVEYSISLGGHSNTIASMTGALCGAYLGKSIIGGGACKQFEGSEMIETICKKFDEATLNIRE